MLIYDRFTQLKLENFQTGGLGYLKDFKTSPLITRELNGTYKLEFEYSLDGLNSSYLEKFNIIKCKFNGKYQLFRITQINKKKTIKVYALHIFFDLVSNMLVDVRPTNQTGTNALKYILSHTKYSNPFEVIGNVTSEKTAYYIRKNPVEAIFSAENSITKVWGGEIDLDNFTIDYSNKIGSDNGVFIEWGKNLKEIEMLIDITDTATQIMPIGRDELLLPEKFIDSPLINNYPYPLIKTVELDIGIDEVTTEEEAYKQMRNAINGMYDSGIDLPLVNIKINYQDLSKTIEYQKYNHLEKINLGDTVTTKVWGMIIKTRVIKIVYDVLKEKIISFELGNEKVSLLSEQKSIITKQIENSNINPNSILEQAQKNATELLTNALGGYVVKTQTELLIMDDPDPNNAKNVWRWNLNGLGFSHNGINGPYETAITQDGKIVANFVTTGTMSVERIEGLVDTIIGINRSIELNQTNIKLLASKIEDFQQTDTSDTNPLILNNCAERQLLKLEIGGNSAQEIRNGRNLYEYKNVLRTSGCSKVGDLNNGYWYKGNTSEGTGHFLASKGWVFLNYLFKPNVEYFISMEIEQVTEGYSNQVAFSGDVDQGTNFGMFDISKTKKRYKISHTFTKEQNLIIKLSSNEVKITDVQIELNEFTDYEPYGIMPSPEFPSEIKNVGSDSNITLEITNKNLALLPDTTITNSGLSCTAKNNHFEITGTYQSAAYFDFKDNISFKLKKGKNTLSTTNSNHYPYIQLYSNSKLIVATDYNSMMKLTFELEEDVVIDRVRLYVGTLNSEAGFSRSFDLQIEEGDTATDFVAPQRKIISIDMQGNELAMLSDNVKDKLNIDSFGNVTLAKRTNKKKYNANQIGKISTTYNNVDYAYIPKQADDIARGKYNSYKVYCTHASYKAISTIDSDKNVNVINTSANASHYWLGFPKGTTAEQMKEALDGVEIEYQLAEPQIIDLGKVEIVPFSPYTRIELMSNADPSSIFCEYLRITDTDNYYVTRSEHEASITITDEKIEQNTREINSLTDSLGNYYTQEQTNQLIQDAQSGLTNIFTQYGGLNIFKNTSLAFSNGNTFEHWEGIVSKGNEVNSATGTCMLLQNGEVVQSQVVLNGDYCISFKYKRLINLSKAKVIINNVIYELENVTEETLFELPISVTSKNIEVKFTCDTNSGYAVYELMVNSGVTKAVYSQAQNEFKTATVSISDEIKVENTNINAVTTIGADGQRVRNATNQEVVNWSTDQGSGSKTLTVSEKADIVRMLVQKQGDMTKIDFIGGED